MPTTVNISPITTSSDLPRAFHICAATFGHQTRDGIWTAFNSGWDTPEGQTCCIQRLTSRWEKSLVDKDAQGRPNIIFLKATVPSPPLPPGQEESENKTTEPIIAGIAIWVQASYVPGQGSPPAEDISQVLDLEALYPGNEREQRYLRQLDRSLHRRRIEVVREKAGREQAGTAADTAAFVLDLCAVHPDFQRRGIASRLVEWGLEEAQRRGGIEAITEASRMGRQVYTQLGFRQEGGEILYEVDSEFADRNRPSNVFLRTGKE